MKASHSEISSGLLLVTIQRILKGDPLSYMDDMEEIHQLPTELLPPLAQPGCYLNLGDRVHEILAQASQDIYLGRAMEGQEPNRSMVFEVVVDSVVNINTAGKIQTRAVEFGNFARNEGQRQSVQEAFAALKEATSYSASLRQANRMARKPAENSLLPNTTVSEEEGWAPM